MAEPTQISSGNGVPLAGEQVHLPGASYLPAWTAFGITIALVGVLMGWAIFGIGVAITVYVVVKWIKETREDMAQLPLEH